MITSILMIALLRKETIVCYSPAIAALERGS
jgi:hypothetical protein